MTETIWQAIQAIENAPATFRIQRSRANGWKKPEVAVYVGRPTKWGRAAEMNIMRKA